MLLVPSSKTLPQRTSVMDLLQPPAELKAKGQFQLVGAELDDVDVMASAYTGLVSEMTGLDKAASGGILNDVRQQRDVLLGGH